MKTHCKTKVNLGSRQLVQRERHLFLYLPENTWPIKFVINQSVSSYVFMECLSYVIIYKVILVSGKHKSQKRVDFQGFDASK